MRWRLCPARMQRGNYMECEMIAYGVCGEGRGHASRALTVVEHLRNNNDAHIVLFAARDAYRFLKTHFEPTSGVTVCPIPGLNFRYVGRRISYLKSMWGSVPFLCKLRSHVTRVAEKLQGMSCNLVISDFEPLTARVAGHLGIPLVTLDHQSFVTHMNLGELTPALRIKTLLMRPFIHLHYGCRPDMAVVSSFFSRQLSTPPAVCNTGVLVRSDLLERNPRHEPLILVYLRNHRINRLIELLSAMERTVIVYSTGQLSSVGNIEFRQIGDARFCDDLVRCDALVCNAGNQVVGEALYLEKPVLAIPEAGNHEQALNGHFLNKTDVGNCLSPAELSERKLRQFLERVPEFRQRIQPAEYVGNRDVFRIVDAMLTRSQRSGVERKTPLTAPQAA